MSKGRKVSDPLFRNANAAAEFTLQYRVGNISIGEMADALDEVVRFGKSHGMVYSERVLLSQANTLDVIFTGLVGRAAIEVNHNANAVEMIRLGLKAQNQCRATLETLSTVRNPARVLIAKQANIANGHQQVNNRITSATKPVAPNELLENGREQWLDCGSPGAAGDSNQGVEAVDKIDRSDNLGG